MRGLSQSGQVKIKRGLTRLNPKAPLIRTSGKCTLREQLNYGRVEILRKRK